MRSTVGSWNIRTRAAIKLVRRSVAIRAAQPTVTERGRARTMIRNAAVIAAVIGMVGHVAAQQNSLLVRFDGAIGVDPVVNVAGTTNADGTFPNVRLNVVRGVSPAGLWTIAGLKASVYADGRITVRGRGLLLAGGNSIGQNANQRVFATLICDAAFPFTERSTALAG